ncbi:hypothetical protein ASD44_09815 [Mesorhizobium sp. Root554]|uniref:hypothetical protein n=1 Tax=unclassified Mesorhizobium TaxID=325217 RepID=UPI0006FEADD8|nr:MULTISPECIES: hypothetical protein [unclassified Mesorhizobium]KQZ14335.1 hypothetical protein ASD27_09825 [Mesorhizobium sp. Root1471]KQZ36846.1 hypothetical protein ASD44_09815 [Mesorhizobium sp. Root554]
MRAEHLHDSDRRRRLAAMLADTLAPLVDAELEATPPRIVVRHVAVYADRDLIQASVLVALAVNELDQAKYAGGREVAARMKLERAARRLRTRLRKRGLADV